MAAGRKAAVRGNRVDDTELQLRALLEESQRAQAELRLSQDQYEHLVSSIDGIVWEADATTLRFTFVSAQAERLLGYPASRWIDDPEFWSQHIHEDDRTWAVDYCRQATHDRQ